MGTRVHVPLSLGRLTWYIQRHCSEDQGESLTAEIASITDDFPLDWLPATTMVGRLMSGDVEAFLVAGVSYSTSTAAPVERSLLISSMRSLFCAAYGLLERPA